MDSKFYKVLDAAPVRAITSSTDATPIEVTTAASHGLLTGDLVSIFGHTTNVAANGTFKITKTAADKFTLQNLNTGANIAGSGAGAGSAGVFSPAAKRLFTQDFDVVSIGVDTDGGGDAAMTVKVVGSFAEDCPDFAAPQSASNQYDYLDCIDLEDASSIDGDVGFVVATADDHRHLEVNAQGLRWISVIPVAGTAGEITITARIFNRN